MVRHIFQKNYAVTLIGLELKLEHLMLEIIEEKFVIFKSKENLIFLIQKMKMVLKLEMSVLEWLWMIWENI